MSLRKLSQAEFHHVLEQTPGQALVCFTARACGACRLLGKVLEKLVSESQDISVYRVDAEQEMGLVREFEVFHLPAMFLYVDGRYHQPVNCAPTEAAIRNEVEQLLAQPAMEAP